MPTLEIGRPGARKLVTPFLRSAVLAVVLIASLTRVLRAQSTHASVTDRVTDPSGAVMVGARVAAVPTDTNFHFDGNPNRVGVLDDSAL